MQVLLVESRSGAGRTVESRLVDAGHRVVRCFDSDRAVACRGAAGDTCPIDEGEIDVALVVRDAEARPQLTEMGAACALRHHLPVAEIGGSPASPFAGTIPQIDADPVTVAEHAIAVGLDEFSAELTAVIRALPDLVGRAPREVAAQVFRRKGALELMLTLPADLTEAMISNVSTWAARAARDRDSITPVIDISVRRV